MDTPFYPDHYDMIEGCKVYTFFVEPSEKVRKKKTSAAKKLIGYALYPFAYVIDTAENAICRTAARAIIAKRRRADKKSPSGEISF